MRWLALLLGSWPILMGVFFFFARYDGGLPAVSLACALLGLLGWLGPAPWARALAYVAWGPAAWWLARSAQPSWLPLVLTQVGLGLSLMLAQAGLPGARGWLLWNYKLAQVRSGRLSYVPGWGWVDRRHALEDVFEELATPGDHHFRHTFFGSWGQLFELEIQTRVETPEQVWWVVRVVAERGEQEEARLGWWWGAGLSAFDADDLPSTYWAIFTRAFPSRLGQPLSPEAAERRWREEGRAVVARQVGSEADFRPADPALERDYLDLCKKLEGCPAPLTLQVVGPMPLD